MGKTGPCQAPVSEKGPVALGFLEQAKLDLPILLACPGDRGQHNLFVHTATSQTHRLALARPGVAVQS